MGLLDTIFANQAKDMTIKAQAKRIAELENTVQSLSADVTELKKRFRELTETVQIISSSQHQLASDMSIIYENVRAVGEVLSGHSTTEDEKYFSWRWGFNDDDDDLPN